MLLLSNSQSVASTEGKTEPDGSAPAEDDDEDVDKYLYCQKDFQPFDSTSYSGRNCIQMTVVQDSQG